MLGFGGCGVTKNLFMDLEIERYIKSQNPIIQRDLQIGKYQRAEAELSQESIYEESTSDHSDPEIGLYQRAEAKLSQVSATRSGSCKRTEESPYIAREKAPGNMTTNYDPEFTKIVE